MTMRLRAARRGTPVVFLGFGAAADEMLTQENPLSLCNRRLHAMGAAPVDW